jgi:hypothetical protein
MIIESLVLLKYLPPKPILCLKSKPNMNNSKKKAGPDTDLRSLLKHQHKKVYSICRLFANNYKEHQRLFADIIAAASQNIRSAREKGGKDVLILRACLNMAALHSIRQDLEPDTDRTIQFKSPDFQRTMIQFRESVGEISDLEKFRLFLELEKVTPDEMADLTGSTRNNPVRTSGSKEKSKKNFIPYLKEKLIWS